MISRTPVLKSACQTPCLLICYFFFFNDTATTEIYTLSLHDALPISSPRPKLKMSDPSRKNVRVSGKNSGDRKSTRLNSSHLVISYAVFCLKKKTTFNIAEV